MDNTMLIGLTSQLTLRRQMGVWANLRPVCPNPALFGASPLRPERLEGVDILRVHDVAEHADLLTTMATLRPEVSR